jgi:hypothetical protein
MTIEKNDLDALELAIEQTLAEDDEPRGAGAAYARRRLVARRDVRRYHRQTRTACTLKVVGEPAMLFDEDDIDADADDIHGGEPALRLLQEMLDLGISRWHPDPLAAIEAAKRKHRKVS